MAKLNAQGMARRSEALMRSLVADPGHSIVSVDLSAGEPTVTTYYSRDKYYKAASFDMVGQVPRWDGDVLLIDDIYLMTMSVSPMGKDKVRAWFDEGLADKWVKDAEGFKSSVKKDRQLHKVLCLGLSYGMGPRKLVETARVAGHDLPMATAKQFFGAYWELFAGVKRLSNNLAQQFKREGHLVNVFGYRLVPEADYKCLNAYIQSSVSGVVNVLTPTFFDLAPYCNFQTLIHDELVFQCPTDRLEDARKAMARATDELNKMLGWSVNIRTGFVSGKDWYEAK